MYKTLYNVMVHPIQGDPIAFADSNETPGAGSAVIAQLTANKDVDSVFDDDGNITHVIFPLHAVDYAEVTEEREETTYEDDNAKNCTESGESETGTLTIRNDKPGAATNIDVQFLLDAPATYSGIEFTVHEGEYTYIAGVIPIIQAGESFVLEGIPVGTEYFVPAATEQGGTVPGTAILPYQN